MSDPLEDPSRFAVVLDRSIGRLDGLTNRIATGRVRLTPQASALILRHTAGILQALSNAGVVSSS